MRVNRFVFIWTCILLLVAAGLISGQAKPQARRSPPYTVLVNLRFSSPFVPDGRMSIAELAMSVTFNKVVFEYDPQDEMQSDSLYCHVDAEEGRGTVSECKLNDVEPESPRHRAHFIRPPQAQFAASLQVQSQEMVADGLPVIPLDAPAIVPLCFRTLFGRNKISWGTSEGGMELDELELNFAVPWLKLLRGEPVSLVLDYKGNWPEDKGKWWIEFMPARHRK